MKKTLTFDDGSVLVGSGSIITVTQEDKQDTDIFDLPSQYIWVQDYWTTLDGYEGNKQNEFLSVNFTHGDMSYDIDLLRLEPSKMTNIKCKVIGYTGKESASVVATKTDGAKEYFWGKSVYPAGNYTRIDCISPLSFIDIENIQNLTQVVLKGDLNDGIIIKGNPKLTTITCDQRINPSIINLSNNSSLVQIPEFVPGKYNLHRAFTNDTSLSNIDTSSFQLTGDCSFAFVNVPITNLTLNDGGCTNISNIAKYCKKLQTVTFNGRFDLCTDFNQAFYTCQQLSDCDMSNVQFGAATNVSYMFYSCASLTTVNINWNTFPLKCSDYSYMFDGTKITDAIEINYGSKCKFNNICSHYTSKVKVNLAPIMYKFIDNGSAFTNATNLQYLSIYQFNSAGIKSWDFSKNTKLGTGSDENLQAFKNLINNAVDVTDGCTVKLAAEQKALLTEDEITTFTNKGYTIE